MLAYYGYFGRARADRIRGIQDQLEHLALVREKIVAEKTRLETLEQQREQRVADLKASQDQRARAVGAANQQIKTRGGELKRLAVRRAPWHKRLRSSPCAASCRGRYRTVRSLPGSASRARVARCAGRAC